MNVVDKFVMHHTDTGCGELFTEKLTEELKNYKKTYSDLIFLCIGTDRSTGDTFGPLVGYYLQQSGSFLKVYGTLDEPVHAMNIKETFEEIMKNYTNPLIIAIDACLGRLEHVGKLYFNHGPLKPGAGVKKELGEYGQFHIKGIVNVGGFMEYFVLQNTRLSLVMNMAKITANSIVQAVINLEEPTRKHKILA